MKIPFTSGTASRSRTGRARRARDSLAPYPGLRRGANGGCVTSGSRVRPRRAERPRNRLPRKTQIPGKRPLSEPASQDPHPVPRPGGSEVAFADRSWPLQPAPNGPVTMTTVCDPDGLLVLLIPAQLPRVRCELAGRAKSAIMNAVTVHPLPGDSREACAGSAFGGFAATSGRLRFGQGNGGDHPRYAWARP